MVNRLLWKVFGNRFGAVVAGFGLIAIATLIWGTGDVKCDDRAMKPGDSCTTVRKGNVTTRSYEEQKSFDDTYRWVLTGIGGVLVVGGVVMIVRRLVRSADGPDGGPGYDDRPPNPHGSGPEQQYGGYPHQAAPNGVHHGHQQAPVAYPPQMPYQPQQPFQQPFAPPQSQPPQGQQQYASSGFPPPHQPYQPPQPQYGQPQHQPAPYSAQPYPAQPYPVQPYPAQSYPAQPGAAQTSSVKPYSGQPYPGQPYPGQAYGAQGYEGQAYGAQEYDGQPVGREQQQSSVQQQPVPGQLSFGAQQPVLPHVPRPRPPYPGEVGSPPSDHS